MLVTADVAFDPELAIEAIDDHISALEARLEATNAGVSKVYIEPEA